MAEKKETEPVAQEPEVSTPKQKEKFDFTRLNTLAVVSLASAISGVGA